MNIDNLLENDRLEVMADIANQYYNLGKNQSEIAEAYQTNRFKIAKLLQDARNEQVVEIRIRSPHEVSPAIEQELLNAFPLKKAIVINTQFSPYIDSLRQIGKAGADYLNQLLQEHSVLGVTWGKTIYSVITQLPCVHGKEISVVQMAGNFKLQNPATDSRALVPQIASLYNGTYHFLDAPLYIKDPALKSALISEPGIQDTFSRARTMDIVLTGIGGLSSLPINNPVFAPYVTPADLKQEEDYIGSLYGYVLDRNGEIADIPLNQKVIATPMEHILLAKHRLAVVYGRHKARITATAMKRQLINEILTDMDTARMLLHHVQSGSSS